MDTISLGVRTGFQEYLVGWSLREICALFDSQVLTPKELSQEQLTLGQRRGLIEKYYANVNWTDSKDIQKVLGVYEDILEQFFERIFDEDRFHNADQQNAEIKQYCRLINGLEKDGFYYTDGKIVPAKIIPVEIEHEAVDLLDPLQFSEYVNRISVSIESNPVLAIDSTKGLVKAVLKAILINIDRVSFDQRDDIPKLLKKVQKALKLVPDDIDNATNGADIIKVLLSNLGSAVIKLTELRNLYRTGHSAKQKRKEMQVTHSSLAVGAGITLATFLLDAFRNRYN